MTIRCVLVFGHEALASELRTTVPRVVAALSPLSAELQVTRVANITMTPEGFLNHHGADLVVVVPPVAQVSLYEELFRNDPKETPDLGCVHSLLEHTDVTIMMDNGALYDI